MLNNANESNLTVTKRFVKLKLEQTSTNLCRCRTKLTKHAKLQIAKYCRTKSIWRVISKLQIEIFIYKIKKIRQIEDGFRSNFFTKWQKNREILTDFADILTAWIQQVEWLGPWQVGSNTVKWWTASTDYAWSTSSSPLSYKVVTILNNLIYGSFDLVIFLVLVSLFFKFQTNWHIFSVYFKINIFRPPSQKCLYKL